MNKMKVVIDSNVWISYLLNKELSSLILRTLESDFEIITCRELVDELIGVLKRNKFKKFVSQEDLQEFISIHLKLCTMIELENIPDLLTDRKDNFLIALYRAGKATAMVTGDKLFIQEASNQKVNAITMAQFKQLSF